MATTHASTSSGPGSRFAATRWTVVLAAAEAGGHSQAQIALGKLAQDYWFPLYAYIRRQGYAVPEAQDLTQEFFARLLERKYLAAVDREKGKFRSFLLASVKHFLANERDKARAQKRGGGRSLIALDALEAEARYAIEPVDDLTPERVFERRWALALLDQVFLRLRLEYQGKNKAKLFEILKGVLTTGKETRPHAEMAQQLGISPGAVMVAAHRLRRRYREILQNEIAQTVSDPALIAEEIRYLRDCL
jgi:RNA polymerase sigma-70 factor (ECF subfamily)